MQAQEESEEFNLTLEEAAAACRGQLPQHAIEGLNLFNQHQFFEAHEALEAAWRAERGPVRELYRGILQVGVAYFKIQHHSFIGARKLFGRAFRWLEPFPDSCRGIDIARFRLDAHSAEEAMLRLGPEHIDEFDPRYFKPIQYQAHEENG